MTVDLTVLSYNIHHGEGLDRVVDFQRLADVISSGAPDLVSVQEVDRKKRRTGLVDQVYELSRLTDMEAAFSVSVDSEEYGQYGNMVLSRLPILRTKTYPLPGEPRSLLETEIDLSGVHTGSKYLMFYATHLDLQQYPRLQSVQKIRKIVTFFSGRSTILAGDLNALLSSPTLLHLLDFMENTTAGKDLKTFADSNGDHAQQIDYILYRPKHRWQVLETKVINEPVASDHFPLMAKLRMV